MGVLFDPATGQLLIAKPSSGAGAVTNVTASAPLTSSGGTTPNIAISFTPENVANKGVANGYASLDGSGLVPIIQVPPAALERLVVVADQTARFALTTATVQNGDTVKQTDINEMFFVIDQTNLNNSSGYSVYVAGTAASVPWGGITGIPAPVTSLSGTNTGDVTLTAVGATPNANGASLSGQALTLQPANATFPGVLTASDWSTFNNKLDKSAGNYITNSDFEVNTTGWNLYNNSGNTAQAKVVAQDITYTAVAAGNAGNGINIDYIFHATQPSSTPLVTVVSSTHITVAWYNGPTIANNPTATQLKAAFDAVPGAVALATSAITGVAGNRQYETGSNITANGGDTSPTTGTGGGASGVTFTRNTSTPLVGTASGDLGKSASSEQGQGISTDFVIDSIDKNQTLQISFAYSGSAAMALGANSDVQVFIYDIDAAHLIPVVPQILAGPISTAKMFVGTFQSSSSSNYRLILHIATTNASAWDLLIDAVIVNDSIQPAVAQEVPSLVLHSQPISGAVTDHMVVMWRDGATQWVPATIAGAALPVFGDDFTQLGFATNIVGPVADIYIRGYMGGFSFGPFTGYQQYIDNTAGLISPLPSPFNDMYVAVGMAISSTALNIQFNPHVGLISNGSGIPVKGGLLTSSAVNDGTGDVVLSPGANGTFLVANSAVAKGLNWRTILAADVPTLNQNTTGSAATLTTPRTIAGTSFNGSANVVLTNKFIVQGTADAGLSGAQFLGALGTGIVKNTTTTGVLSIAVAGDFPTLNQNTTGTATNVTGVVALVNGGTGTAAASANAAFNALSPLTTLGDITYEDATPKATRLPGNTTTTKQYLSQTGNGTISAAPVWSTIASGDITNSSSISGATLTDALNTISGNFTEVFLSAIKNAGAVVANTEIPTWTTVTKDTNSAFNASTGTFTVPIAGDYVVEFHADTTALTPTAQIYKNGVLIQTGINSLTRTFVTTTLANCAVNDTIWVALDTTATIASTNTDTILNIYKVVGPAIGPVNARYHSSSTTITSSLATITYTTQDFDTQASAYVSGVYTIPSAGKYSVKASLALTAATAAAGNNYDIIIRKNSVEISRNKFVVGAATQKPNVVVVQDLVSCALNDTIDIQASAAGTTPSISASTTMNYFTINKVSI